MLSHFGLQSQKNWTQCLPLTEGLPPLAWVEGTFSGFCGSVAGGSKWQIKGLFYNCSPLKVWIPTFSLNTFFIFKGFHKKDCYFCRFSITSCFGLVVSTWTFFRILKPNGNGCSILHLKYLNRFFQAQGFKIESVHTIVCLLHPCYFLASVEPKDAYHVLIFPP